MFSLLSSDWRMNWRKNKTGHKTNATPKTAHNKQNIQERKRKLWKGIKMSRPRRIQDLPIWKQHALTNQNLPPICSCSDFWRGQWLVCVPCQSLEGSEIKPVTKTCTATVLKRGGCQHSRAPFILINTHALEFICKTTLTPLVKIYPPLSPF